MKRYIALLRGINVSGRNKIAMAELKEVIAGLGYTDIRTHLNSGNVVFTTETAPESDLADRIHGAIAEHWQMDIPVFVIAQADLQVLLEAAPDWWGTEDKDIYDNLVFVLHGHDAETVSAEIGSPTEELEMVQIVSNSVFWSFDRKRYAKANWWKKTAAPGIGERLTIRTAGTLRKIAGM